MQPRVTGEDLHAFADAREKSKRTLRAVDRAERQLDNAKCAHADAADEVIRIVDRVLGN